MISRSDLERRSAKKRNRTCADIKPNDNYGPSSESYFGANFEGCCWNDEGILDPIVGFVAECTRVPEPGTFALLGLGVAVL